MIHVTLKDNALWARGHSGSGPRGQDILCAAVSILMEATAAALARQDRLLLGYFGNGSALLSRMGTAKFWRWRGRACFCWSSIMETM